MDSCPKCHQFRGINPHQCSTRQITPIFKRFVDKHQHEKDRKKCWLWRGAKDSCGYGKMINGSRKDDSRTFVSAHRYAYKFYVGPIPLGLSVLHRCDVRSCVNPLHLYAGTQKQNVLDAVKRGRWTQVLKCRKDQGGRYVAQTRLQED